MRSLDRITLSRELGQFLTGDDIDALLARRDRIVEHLDRMIAQKGEAEVLFDESQ
jgi:hypothetical protein